MAEISIPSTNRAASITAGNLVPLTQGVLRIGAGLLFMQHGAQKLFGVLGGTQVEWISQMGLAGVLELVGGALIVVGLLTRPVAAVLALLMIAAYVIAHAPLGIVPIQNHGELALLYALVFAFLSAGGAGAYSLDQRLRADHRAGQQT